MTPKTYILKRQINNKGYYIEITSEVDFIPIDDRKLIIHYYADPNWEILCKAGIIIFFDYFCNKSIGLLEVKILKIKWMAVDTNNLIVLFGTIKALCESLDFSVPNLSLDDENEFFIFPDIRLSI